MLELVRDFVNTYDVETDADELTSPAELALWLRERGLAAEGDRAGDDDLTTAIALREALRAGLRRAAPVDLPGVALRVTIDGTPRLTPMSAGVPGGLAAIAAAVLDPGWERLKVCSEGTCQWAFIDASKNRSRSWCSMKVCGNRTKTRAYRARKHGSRRLQGSNTDTV
ncbi:CGNR zinc finger domain-containing protein [Nonomuraea typhae]|uniref:CGNR zinc finger domain-containing protein n=1 Tax=Nonomuraea typhae TaxID=2603600 RepID=A0ABW7YTI8_9ACTN